MRFANRIHVCTIGAWAEALTGVLGSLKILCITYCLETASCSLAGSSDLFAELFTSVVAGSVAHQSAIPTSDQVRPPRCGQGAARSAVRFSYAVNYPPRDDAPRHRRVPYWHQRAHSGPAPGTEQLTFAAFDTTAIGCPTVPSPAIACFW
jgi:hypothetical protein